MNYNLLALLLSSTLFFQACDKGDIDGNVNAPLFTSLDTASVYENQTSAITLIASNATISVSTDSNETNETNSTDSNETYVTFSEGKIVYSISGEESDSFVLNESSGIVLFINPPDYEIKTSYEFIATATNTKGIKTDQEVTINILDIDESQIDTQAPAFQSPSSAYVDENETFALTLIATDNVSAVTYSIDSNDSASDHASFAVNPTNGEVVFINRPDYETKTSYTFTAVASDASLNRSTQKVFVTIVDVDEINPQFTSSSSASVYENQIDAITLIATDNESSILYSISQNDSDSFLVDEITGVVTFKAKPDYETKPLYSFTAKAEDLTRNSVTQSVNIHILDIDETIPDTQGPIFTSASTVDAYEDQTSALTITASDNISDVTYFIWGGDSDSFVIGSDSGIVLFKQEPNYDVKILYEFTATAVDEALNETDQSVSINILEKDYEAPVFISDANASVDENQTSAMTVEATDNMSTALIYSILNGDDGASFDIVSTTGVVTFISAPNYSIKSRYLFTAQAMDEQENKKVQAISIEINDPN